MNATCTGIRLEKPRSIEEAVAMRMRNPSSRYLAGGTDLVVNLRRGIAAPDTLIDLAGIDELRQIDSGAHGHVIGTGVTIARLAQHFSAANGCRALAEAACAIAGPGHRTMATLGGNLCLDTRCIYYNQSEWWRRANHYCLKHGGTVCHVAPQGQRCHATYSGDLAPALLVLGAKVEIAGADGRRQVPLADLYVENGLAHLSLQAGELVTAVRLPPDAHSSRYAKLRTRAAVDFPLCGVAVALAKSDARIGTLKIALTGTNSRPFLLAGTESMSGSVVDAPLLKDVERLVHKQVQPMRTTLTTANYRRIGAGALAVRLVGELFASG